MSTSGWLPNDRGPFQNPSMRVSPGNGDSLGAAEAPWYFPPGSPGSEPPTPVPQTFLDWLRAHDERLTVTWHPVLERHVIWCRNRKGGWSVSVVCQNPFSYRWCDLAPGEACPLDTRVKAILQDSDPRRYGGAKAMWTHLMDREQKAAEAKYKMEMDRMLDQRERAVMHATPRVGYGQSRSKMHDMYQ